MFTDADSLMYEIKTEDVYEGFSKNKEMFDLNNIWIKSKYYNYSNRLVVGKMKDETGGVAIKRFVRLKSEVYSLLVDYSSVHKKAKGVNNNVVPRKAIVNTKMFCWIRNLWILNIRWIASWIWW